MLDTIQDPGNMGTIISCADWFGIQSDHLQQGFGRRLQSKICSIVYGQYLPGAGYLHRSDYFLSNIVSIPVYAATLNGNDISLSSSHTGRHYPDRERIKRYEPGIAFSGKPSDHHPTKRKGRIAQCRSSDRNYFIVRLV